MFDISVFFNFIHYCMIINKVRLLKLQRKQQGTRINQFKLCIQTLMHKHTTLNCFRQGLLTVRLRSCCVILLSVRDTDCGVRYL